MTVLLLYKKCFSESQDGRNFGCALFVICTRVTTLDSCYMKNALVFSQSEARYFFLVYNYIPNQLRSESLEFKYETFCKLKYIL